MIIIKLKARAREKIKRGHLWIFSDEIVEVDGDENIGIANLFFEDEFVGRGLYNSNAKNSTKFLTKSYEKINKNFFVKRFKRALSRRTSLPPFRREVNAEGDFLPGLIVDRFGSVLVVQIRSLALEKMKDKIIDALIETYSPKSIYERSDFESIPENGLSREKKLLYGPMPEPQIVEENGLKFMVDVVNGQKTGFFYDQRDSRTFVKKISTQGKGLDLFTYTGAFALLMASKGMKVDGVDISKADLQVARKNAYLNRIDVNFLEGDAFDLETLGKYDFIIADPPSLIKRREEKPKAFNLLNTLMDQIFDHLNANGIVGICSCAYNIDREMLLKIVGRSARNKNRIVRPIKWTGLPIDHPHLLSMPETNYLKCLWFEALSDVI